MKPLIVASLVSLAMGVSASALAADHVHGVAQTQATLGEGVVKKVDKAAGKLVIAHGSLPGGMPAMTMAFRVKDAAWIDQVKEGQKIRFAADDVNGTMTVVRFELAK